MEQEETTLIFDIEKFAVHDGPGIRTNVFMKGCPLRCKWCHNPESQTFQTELFFNEKKCTLCGQCALACPNHCHDFSSGKHVFDRTNCIRCGKCTDKCFADALEAVGKKMTVSEVMKQVLSDKLFYENSGGGITLSGGEPLAHFKFTKALLEAAKKENLNTAVETCGFAPWEQIEQLIPLVDLWLWDVKASPADHETLTGVPAEPILENLGKLDLAGGKMYLRCPLIPGINDSDADLIRIAELANSLKNVQRIDLEPYHPLGEEKSVRLGRTEYFRSEFTKKETVNHYGDVIKAHTKVEVYRP